MCDSERRSRPLIASPLHSRSQPARCTAAHSQSAAQSLTSPSMHGELSVRPSPYSRPLIMTSRSAGRTRSPVHCLSGPSPHYSLSHHPVLSVSSPPVLSPSPVRSCPRLSISATLSSGGGGARPQADPPTSGPRQWPATDQSRWRWPPLALVTPNGRLPVTAGRLTASTDRPPCHSRPSDSERGPAV